MITTIFSKTRPFNYILIALLLTFCFISFGFNQNLFKNSETSFLSALNFLFITLALLATNFIGIKSNLTKNNTFTVLFYFLVLLMFPEVFTNANLVFSNLLIVLALRRLMAVQSLKNIRQKLFDASILIFLSAIFEFWTILFILLVYIIIIFFAARDYRNWVVPIIALGASTILLICFTLQFDSTVLDRIIAKSNIYPELSYFSNVFQNVSFSVYSTISFIFILQLLLSYTKKPLAQQSLYRFIFLSYMIGVAVFLVAPNKQNSYLIYTFAPFSIMACNFFENIETKWIAETSAILISIIAFACFFGQL